MLRSLTYLIAVGVAVSWLASPERRMPSPPEPRWTVAPVRTTPGSPLPEAKPSRQIQAEGRVIYVTGNSVRVRAGPGTGFTILDAYKRGVRLRFTGRRDGAWLAILDEKSGREGWMHEDYLSFDRPRPAAVARAAAPAAPRISDRKVRDRIIAASLARYPGSCPCPYNRDRAGRKCGRRSAYSRPGGYSPLCYQRDVSDVMVAKWRASNPGG